MHSSEPENGEDPQSEVRRLRQLLAAYEQLNAYGQRELVKAQRVISAYEEAQDLSQEEILQLRSQMRSGLRVVADTLEEQIKVALAAHSAPDAAAVTALRTEHGERFYPAFFRVLAHQDFPADEARIYFEEIQEHARGMTRAMGRDVTFPVAMLDYFLTHRPVFQQPKLIELATFDEVARNSVQDGLTGLYNRRYLDRALLQEVRRAERHSQSAALLVIDIDNFKRYNDSFGHAEGDEVMRTIGGLLMTTFREEDIACRYGGEEFVVILPQTDSERALHVADRFLQTLRNTTFPRGRVTVSGGIADYPHHGKNPGDVFLAADRAQYRAKHDGKDRIYLADYSANRLVAG